MVGDENRMHIIDEQRRMVELLVVVTVVVVGAKIMICRHSNADFDMA